MVDLTKGHVGGVILKFAIPMLLGNLFQQLYSVVDTIIVGKFIGKEALAAVGASQPIIFAIVALVIGIGTGSSVVISQYFGARDFNKVRRAVDTTYVFLFYAGVITSVVGILLSRKLFVLLQLPEELMQQATDYLNIYLVGMVAFFGFNGTAAILRGIGDSKTPLYFLIVATVANIGLDLLFILPFGWGVAGAAWATVISQVGALVTIIIVLNRKSNLIRFAFKGMQFDWAIFRQSIRIGLPTGIQQTFVALGQMALMGIVNTFGTSVIAGYTAAGRIDSFASMPAMNISMALSVFVGQNLGAGKIARIGKGLRSSLLFASIFSVFTTIIALLWSVPLMKIFTTDPEVIAVGREYLIIVGIFYLIFSTMFTFTGLLRGAGATLIPMFISLFSLWLVRIPLAFFLTKIMGEQGIWWSIPMAWFIGMCCSFAYYRWGNWKDKGVVKIKPAG